MGVDIPLFPEQVTVDLNQVGDVIGGDVCVADEEPKIVHVELSGLLSHT
jgi:hypothetical protein